MNRKYQPIARTRLPLTEDAVNNLSIYLMFASGSYPSLVTKLVLERRMILAYFVSCVSLGYSILISLVICIGWYRLAEMFAIWP